MKLQTRITDQEAEQLKQLSKQLYGKENTSGYIAKVLRSHLATMSQEVNSIEVVEPMEIVKPAARSMQRELVNKQSRPRTNTKKKPLTVQELQQMVDDKQKN